MDVRVFNGACAGPEGVASKDGGHKNPAGGTNPDRVSGRDAQPGVCFLLVSWSTSGC